MSERDGGPVFPCTTKELVEIFENRGKQLVDRDNPGISLRDLYAGMVMMAIVIGNPSVKVNPIGLVQDAWTVAHNMIVEREKRG